MAQVVVAHLRDGRIVKGTTLDAGPGRPTCHVRTEAGVVQVEMEDTKAIYFVHDLEGDSERQDDQVERAGDPRRHGMQRVELHFEDGERLLGFVASYPPRGATYFVIPADMESNNERVLVNAAAVRTVSSPPPAGGA